MSTIGSPTWRLLSPATARFELAALHEHIEDLRGPRGTRAPFVGREIVGVFEKEIFRSFEKRIILLREVFGFTTSRRIDSIIEISNHVK